MKLYSDFIARQQRAPHRRSYKMHAIADYMLWVEMQKPVGRDYTMFTNFIILILWRISKVRDHQIFQVHAGATHHCDICLL